MTSTLSIDTTETDAVSHAPGIIVPTDIDNNPIRYSGNPAHIPGLLHELDLWVNRTGHFKEFIEHGAVLLSNAKVAFDSSNAVKFYRGDAVDGETYSLLKPCPDTATRIGKYNAVATVSSSPAFSTIATAPLDNNQIVQPLTVQKKDRQLAETILAMWEDSDDKGEFQADCAGSGRKLIELLILEADKATQADHILVDEQLANYVRAGIIGEVTLESFNQFTKGYYKLNRRVLPANRKSAAAEMQMFHTAIMKDRDLRSKYELKLDMRAPTTPKDVLKLIRGMLRTDKVYAQIDEATHGTSGGSVALTASQTALLTSMGVDLSRIQSVDAAKIADAVIAKQSALVGADPRKTAGGSTWRDRKPSNYTDWPRDEHGNITKWVPGMGLCGCNSRLGNSGIGEHPRHLCPVKKWAGTPQGETKGSQKRTTAQPKKQTSLVAPITVMPQTDGNVTHAPIACDPAGDAMT